MYVVGYVCGDVGALCLIYYIRFCGDVDHAWGDGVCAYEEDDFCVVYVVAGIIGDKCDGVGAEEGGYGEAVVVFVCCSYLC